MFFKAESDKAFTDENADPYFFDVKSIDVVFNPDFNFIKQYYRLPVFFKSSQDQGYSSFISQGYVDNGREKIYLNDTGEAPEEAVKPSDQKPRLKRGPARSITERLKA